MLPWPVSSRRAIMTTEMHRARSRSRPPITAAHWVNDDVEAWKGSGRRLLLLRSPGRGTRDSSQFGDSYELTVGVANVMLQQVASCCCLPPLSGVREADEGSSSESLLRIFRLVKTESAKRCVALAIGLSDPYRHSALETIPPINPLPH